ncbi:GIN domain-containing protein [Pedobacter sp.]|uniref:GIN domain-containing protein n=1 Tax=Pedobacter sp. TaxID=1411316 RepID=UPI003D7F7ED0
MKTSIKTLFATALSVLFLSTSAFTVTANDSVQTKKVSATNMNVNMVVVSGPVDVYLIQSDHENIKIVSINNEEPALSIKKNGSKLVIEGAENERVTMYVYLKDLKRIDASEQATVRTQGNFDLDALQILLKDDARANVNVKTKSLYTELKDKAALKLSGSTGSHHIKKGSLAKIKMHDFNANETQASSITAAYAASKNKK